MSSSGYVEEAQKYKRVLTGFRSSSKHTDEPSKPSKSRRDTATGTAPNIFSVGMASQCDVARRPSSRPAAARITEPEHTDVVQLAARWA